MSNTTHCDPNVSRCCIPSNSDVDGIGIRVNLYATILLMALIPDVPGKTAPLREVIVGNAGLSGLALLITALTFAEQKKLSLYHAIFIIHMLYFTGIMVAPAGHYKHSTFSRRAIVSGLLTYGSYLVFTGYALSIWARGTQFGTTDNIDSTCNGQIKYIFFFREIEVKNDWLRILWMVGLGISLSLLIVLPVFGCVYVFRQNIGRNDVEGNTEEGEENDTPVHAAGSTTGPNKSFATILWVGKVLTSVYGVVMLELYENANTSILQDGVQDWTFGQIFALVQLIGSLNEAIHCLISMGNSSEDSEQSSVTSSQNEGGQIPNFHHDMRQQEASGATLRAEALMASKW